MSTPSVNVAPVAVPVALGERSYEVLVGPGLIAEAGTRLIAALDARRVAIVTDENVAALHLAPLRASLKQAGLSVVEIVLPAGEGTKCFAELERLLDQLLAARIERRDVVLALGGGVMGDLAGFAASILRRGVVFVQVPTTLLAQVDSSVGGKTGINTAHGKNLIGAFHQPRLVLADTSALDTLPARELRAGLAEVIKYALVFDLAFLGWLEHNLDALLALDPAALAHAIYRSCELKAEVVLRDEHEQGERALLNFGHTFGHAIETATGYTQWLHGEAVAAGMLIAADMSSRLGLLPASDVQRVRVLLQRAGLAIDPPRMTAARAMQLMGVDKKVRAGRIRLVLLEALGRARFTADYPDDALSATLIEYFD
jgi:3-dehydroquinate synthase